MLNKMRRLVPVAFLAGSLAVSALGVAACGGSVEAGPQGAETVGTRSAVAKGAHGPVKWIGLALSDVQLRPDQRAEIEKLASEAEARHASTRQARTDFMNALAAQVERGSIDRAALKPQIDAVSAAFDQTMPADRAALERLHAILDPEQRAAFVDALKAKKHELHGAKGHHRGGPMMAWAKDLNLSEDQKKAIREALHDQWKGHEHGKGRGHHAWHHGGGPRKMLEAFKGDRFVLDEIAPPSEHKPGMFLERMVGAAEAIVPILTPEQRTIAAQKLRTFGAEMGEGKGF